MKNDTYIENGPFSMFPLLEPVTPEIQSNIPTVGKCAPMLGRKLSDQCMYMILFNI